MGGFRQPEVGRDQFVLWSHRLEEAVPPDHPVRLLDALLHSEAFVATFREWERQYDLRMGQPPYHPRDLAGLYLYGMLNRIRSSRQLEAACYNRLDVIWLMSGQKPDHSTIAAFVTRHAAGLRRLFRNVVAVGVKAGLITLEHVATDGTKIEADAGRGSVRSEEKIRSWLSHLDETLAALEAEWEKNERQEATLFGEQAPWAPSARDTPAKRLVKMQRQQARLKEALAELARRQKASAGAKPVKSVASTTDPTSRNMKDKEGRVKPNYNAQMTVDTAKGMIVADRVNDAAEDSGQLTPMLEEVEVNCGRKPVAASADSQYNTGPELARLEALGVVGYLPDTGTNSEGRRPDPAQAEALSAARSGKTLTESQWSSLPRDAHRRIDKSAFHYERDSDTYRCPAGHRLTVLRTSVDRKKKWGVAVRRQYGFAVHASGPPPPCTSCVQAAFCCRHPAKGRTINRDQFEDHRERLRARMNSDAGRALYDRRKQTVEPRFGQIKHGLGVRRFLRRGLRKVGSEYTLVCTAVNVGILLTHWKEVSPVL